MELRLLHGEGSDKAPRFRDKVEGTPWSKVGVDIDTGV